jgi:hypothetical protein
VTPTISVKHTIYDGLRERLLDEDDLIALLPRVALVMKRHIQMPKTIRFYTEGNHLT